VNSAVGVEITECMSCPVIDLHCASVTKVLSSGVNLSTTTL
jgi:hypothetical protein